MKRVIALLAVLVVLFSACSSEPEQVATDELKESTVIALEAAIDTLDKFLSFEMRGEDAEEKLKTIYDAMDVSYTLGYVARTYVQIAHLNTMQYNLDDSSEKWKAVEDAKVYLELFLNDPFIPELPE